MIKTTGKNNRRAKVQPVVALIGTGENKLRPAVGEKLAQPVREFDTPILYTTCCIVKRLPEALHGQLPMPQHIAALLEKV
jgi:hypothetical protein